MVIKALLLKILALTLMMKKILEERLRFIGLLDHSLNTGKIGLGLTIVVLDKPVPTVAMTVEVKDDDINILQVHVTGNLITMLCSLKNRIFSSTAIALLKS